MRTRSKGLIVFFSLFFLATLVPICAQSNSSETTITITNARQTTYEKDEKNDQDSIILEGGVEISVKKGATVKKGQTIGEVGNTGNVKTPQLHFEVRKGTKAVNPVNYLKNEK